MEKCCSTKCDSVTIGSTDDGIPFMKSNVWNCVLGPKSLELVCLRDFASECTIHSKSKDEIETDTVWSKEHPSRNHITVEKQSKEKTLRMPTIIFKDLPNTMLFGVDNIETCDMTACSESENHFMEKHSKTASLPFMPFRNTSDLTDDDKNVYQNSDAFHNTHQTNL